jgi:hypothetical protein
MKSKVTARISKLNCSIGCAVEATEQVFRSSMQSSSIAYDVLMMRKAALRIAMNDFAS